MKKETVRSRAHAKRGAVVRPIDPVGEELESFFSDAEGDLDVRSTYVEMLVPVRHRESPIDQRLLAARAYTIIYDRLRAIGDPHAGVLQCAYSPRLWPPPLAGCLGRLTGVVVRLAAAEYGLPDDDGDLARLEITVATRLAEALENGGPATLSALKQKAERHFYPAYRAYLKHRALRSAVRGRS